MTIAYLAFRNLIAKPLNLMLSLMLLMLSVSLVTFSLQFREQLDDQLSKNIAPFDMVVGAKGSPLQLVLSSVLHIDAPTGNIQLKEVETIVNHPYVETAIPISYGDNYRGFRILGTEPEYLNHYEAKVGEGEMFHSSFEVIVGHTAAKRLGLQVGESFMSSHGLVESDLVAHEEHPYRVTGILEATGTVVDQLLITPLESIWDAHDHGEHDDDETHSHGDYDHKDSEQGEHAQDEHEHDDGHHHDEYMNDGKKDLGDYDEEKEITSLLVKFKNPMGMIQLPRFINENTAVQAALPGFEVQRLMHLFGSGVQAINGIALAILLISGLSIFISILKSIRERRRELALLRTYGFSTFQLFELVLLEGMFLALFGCMLGWLLSRLGIWGISYFTESAYGYTLQITGPNFSELVIFGVVLAIAIVATILASFSVFKISVAKTLTDA